MADESPELRTLKRLINAHDTELARLKEYNNYYEGTQPLSYMHPDLQIELEDRIRQVVVNWPRLIIDSVEERLDVEGFRYPGVDEAADDLWEIWQYNNLDQWSQQGHVDAMSMRRAFTVVSTNDADADMPLISVESPLEMHVEMDPATRRVLNGVKRFKKLDETNNSQIDMATLYLSSGRRIPYSKKTGEWEPAGDPVQVLKGKPPINILPNRPRLLSPLGCSDLDDIIPLSDAACKIATDMMVAAEFHAVAQRWVFGVGPEEFVDEAGNRLSTWQAVLGRVWANKNPDAKAGQFTAADLKNFHDTLNTLGRIVASIAGLPVNELGFITQNPPSADALRALEIRRIKRAERKQRGFEGGWESTMLDSLEVAKRTVPEGVTRLETIWRDPSTPTVAQKADAAVKLYTAEIVPLRQTREDLGYSQTQIERMEAEDAKVDPMARIGRPGPDDPPPPPAD